MELLVGSSSKKTKSEVFPYRRENGSFRTAAAAAIDDRDIVYSECEDSMVVILC